jgi:hypothetical protein
MNKKGKTTIVVLAHSVLIVLIVINLSIPYWFKWCAFDFGIYKLYQEDGNSKHYQDLLDNECD